MIESPSEENGPRGVAGEALLDRPSPSAPAPPGLAADLSWLPAGTASIRRREADILKYFVVMVGAFPEEASRIKGGVQASVYGLAKALRQIGESRVTVFAVPLGASREPVRRAVMEGIEVVYLNAPWRFLASGIVHVPRVLEALKGEPRAVVHVHGTGLFRPRCASSCACRGGRWYGRCTGSPKRKRGSATAPAKPPATA